jgi:hypothetical protein
MLQRPLTAPAPPPPPPLAGLTMRVEKEFNLPIGAEGMHPQKFYFVPNEDREDPRYVLLISSGIARFYNAWSSDPQDPNSYKDYYFDRQVRLHSKRRYAATALAMLRRRRSGGASAAQRRRIGWCSGAPRHSSPQRVSLQLCCAAPTRPHSQPAASTAPSPPFSTDVRIA